MPDSMPRMDRMVAGIRCREVLADLSDYIDGLLPEDRVAQINEHLRGCDWCERFGGEFSAIIKIFRQALREPEPISEDVERRLRERVRRGFSTDQI